MNIILFYIEHKVNKYFTFLIFIKERMEVPPKKTKTPEKNRVQFQLFNDAEEAWFWFIQAQQARNDGARFTAGMSLVPRPCEPSDILKILDRLYRNRFLMRDHLLVLRHYGRRQLAPDPHRIKEAVAYKLWREAMDRIEPVLIRKEIIHPKNNNNFPAQRLAVHSQDSYQGMMV